MKQDVREIPVGIIVPDEDQPRIYFDKAKLWELGRSMKAEGQLQDAEGWIDPSDDPSDPEVVYLLDGERRLKACELVGLKTLRVKIIPMPTPAEKLMRQLLYNTGEPNTIMEKINKYNQAIDEFQMTVAEVSSAMGVTVAVIEKDLPLSQLHEKIQLALDKGEISKPVCRKIVELPVNKHQDAFNRALKGRTAKQQLANVEAYIAQVQQTKLWDESGVPNAEALMCGQKLVAFMGAFTRLHDPKQKGNLINRMNSAVGARSRRIPDLQEFVKALNRFSNDLETSCAEYEANAKVNKAAA